MVAADRDACHNGIRCYIDAFRILVCHVTVNCGDGFADAEQDDLLKRVEPMPEPEPSAIHRATIKAVCQSEWEAHKSDCSGFVKAVAAALGINLAGQANAIIDTMGRMPWAQLGTDMDAAARYARLDYLVIAGLKESAHGHLAVVVPSVPPLPLKGYWGSLGRIGQRDTKLSLSWRAEILPSVQYFAIKPPSQ